MTEICDRDSKSKDYDGRFSALPGDDAPDILLKTTAEKGGDTRHMTAAELHKTDEQVSYALNVVAGIDHHDFIREFALTLNQDIFTTRRALTHIWLQEASNISSARTFIEQLRTAINREL